MLKPKKTLQNIWRTWPDKFGKSQPKETQQATVGTLNSSENEALTPEMYELINTFPPSSQNNSRAIMRENIKRVLRMPNKNLAAWLLQTKFGLSDVEDDYPALEPEDQYV